MDAHTTKVALVVHVDQPEAAPLARRVRAWWEARGYEVVEIDDVWNAPDDQSALLCAVSLGGDGTMLRTIHFAMNRRVPVIGVNLGSFGYLTQVEPDQMETAFGQFVDGDVAIDERMVLDVRVERASGASERHLAVNEAAIERNSAGRTLPRQRRHLEATVPLVPLRWGACRDADGLDRLQPLAARPDRLATARGVDRHADLPAHAL